MPKENDMLWFEMAEVVMARTAYQGRLSKKQRPPSMSHFLIKTRNRKAEDPRDKLYGLYYLFETFGYRFPAIGYLQPVAKIYEDITLCLVEQSRSWWILTHLFNRRNLSTLKLHSYVPDFAEHAAWRQAANVRFRNAQDMSELEVEDDRDDGATREKFLVKDGSGVIKAEATFLWTIANATPEMPANAPLDLSLEQSFDLDGVEVLVNATEDFLFILAGWLKSMDPSNNMEAFERSDSDSVASGEIETLEGYDSNIEALMMRAVGTAFYRSSTSAFLGKQDLKADVRAKYASDDEDDPPEAVPKQDEDLGSVDFQEFASYLLPEILNNIRRCISPDARHPCRQCGTTASHASGEAAEHLMQWMKDNISKQIRDLMLIFYTRAVDHSLFLTTATNGGCGGHFGFCRNLPRAGDDDVLLPGLSDPVVLRRKAAVKPGDVDTYRVIGVTTGMIGSPLTNSEGEETAGPFCLGSCPEIESVSSAKPRSFYLV